MLSPDELKGKPLSDVPSGSGDKTDNIEVIEIIDQKLDEYYKDLTKAKAIVEDRIDKLTLTDIEDEIMRYRYVSCMEWREVARCCGYTERHVRRMDSEIMVKIIKINPTDKS